MKNLQRIIGFFCLLMVLTLNAKATWSIIVIDPKTKQIGIAGASCTFSVYGIGAIVPGKGAIVVQAMSNPLARLKGIQMIVDNATPKEILAAIRQPQFYPEQQQYAIVCVSAMAKPQTYTGTDNNSFKGAVTTTGIAVQGNTLNNTEMLDEILKVAIKAQKDGLSIQEVLMLALETGAKYGGDNRCGERKASSAFLTVANPADEAKHPFLNLIVNQTDETTNAVSALRNKFNNWKIQQRP